MEARRRAEGKTVEIFLDQPYRLKAVEEEKFLDESEGIEINTRINEARALMADPNNIAEVRRRASEIRDNYIHNQIGSIAPRVSMLLLRSAVEMRYRKPVPGGERVEIPRKGPDKTKPGVWWGEIIETIDEKNFPSSIDVTVQVAQWLVATWQDEKVQNGFPADIQVWVNTFEREIDRVQAELEKV